MLPPTNASPVGAVRSTLTFETDAVESLPARSTADPDAAWTAPSPNVEGAEQLATPEPESPHDQVSVGAPVEAFHHPVVASGLGESEPLIEGAVRSTSTSETDAVALLPALSTPVPVSPNPAPAPNTCGAEHV